MPANGRWDLIRRLKVNDIQQFVSGNSGIHIGNIKEANFTLVS